MHPSTKAKVIRMHKFGFSVSAIAKDAGVERALVVAVVSESRRQRRKRNRELVALNNRNCEFRRFRNLVLDRAPAENI